MFLHVAFGLGNVFDPPLRFLQLVEKSIEVGETLPILGVRSFSAQALKPRYRWANSIRPRGSSLVLELPVTDGDPAPQSC